MWQYLYSSTQNRVIRKKQNLKVKLIFPSCSSLMYKPIASDVLSLNELFENKFFIVPIYQREYSWDTNSKDQEVNKFWEDIVQKFFDEELEDDDNPCSEKVSDYFLGSIIVCPPDEKAENRFELIDGQQRLTTIFLFAKAVINFAESEGPRLKNHKNISEILNTVNKLNKQYDNSADTYNLKLDLQYEHNSLFLKKLSELKEDSIIQIELKESSSIKRMKDAYNYFLESLKESFSTKSPDKFSQFCRYFLDKVKVVFVQTANRSLALKVFGTLNNRGKSLSALDLLKNLIFLQMQEDNIEDDIWQQISQKWKELTDRLDSFKIKPEEFLRYSYLAHFNEAYTKVREDDVYNLLEGHFKNQDNPATKKYLSEPTALIDDFLSDLNAWTYFKQGKNIHGDQDLHLRDLLYFSPKAKQHVILLLAGRKLDNESFNDLTNYVEDITFIQTISSGDSGTKKFEPDFAQLAKLIRKIKTRQEFQSEVMPILRDNRKKLEVEFENRFSTADTKKSKIFKRESTQKYVLGKFEQFLRLQFDKNLDSIETILQKAELEHIAPQTIPSAYANKFSEDDIYRLGNLTLISGRSNKVSSNNVYENKKPSYTNQNFYLTKFLVNPVDGKSLPKDIKDIKDFRNFDTWNKTNIDIRQRVFSQFAKKIWIDS